MSVYTSLSLPQLKQLLAQHDLGEILSYEGISDGIENTNYRIQTDAGRYILTIFEQYKATDLPYFLQLMAFLRSQGLTVPDPVADTRQQVLMSWQSKPAALFNHLSGQSNFHPQIEHCRQIGSALGQFHRLGQQFPLYKSNEWGSQWIQQTGNVLLQDSLDENDAQLLADELIFQKKHRDQTLPRGVIHADLFRDNVLFDENHLSGILDFYTACNAPLLFDLAVTVNDWCSNDDEPDSYLHYAKAKALIEAYEQVRPLKDKERQYWPVMLRVAALRFWLSRLLYRQSRQEAHLFQDKNPDVLKYLLLKHRENEVFCQSLMYS